METGSGLTEQTRLELVAETFASVNDHGESLGELAHDARNMVTALSLYCDLLEEPGVLPPSYRHYGSELRLVVEASRRLLEKLAHVERAAVCTEPREPASVGVLGRRSPLFAGPESPALNNSRTLQADPDGWIDSLREELTSVRNLLDSLAGPSITVMVSAEGGNRPVSLSTENLIRILVNLVKNAVEFIPTGGLIRIHLSETAAHAENERSLRLVVEDSGCGIPEPLLEKIFAPGFTTRPGHPSEDGWASGHRGLGLSITRSLVEAAGGSIRAENAPQGGARFVIELPIWVGR